MEGHATETYVRVLSEKPLLELLDLVVQLAHLRGLLVLHGVHLQGYNWAMNLTRRKGTMEVMTTLVK